MFSLKRTDSDGVQNMWSLTLLFDVPVLQDVDELAGNQTIVIHGDGRSFDAPYR